MKTLLIQRLDRKEPTEEDKDRFKEFANGQDFVNFFRLRPNEALLVNRGGIEYELILEDIKPVITCHWV